MSEPVVLSGRALDALVAERVMGAKWNAAPPEYTESEWLQFPERGRGGMPILAYRYANEGRDRVYKPSLPAYSSDISSAFSVVEKMRERGFAYGKMGWFVDDDAPQRVTWWVILEGDRGREHLGPECETLPLAICLAALKALDAETLPATSAVEGLDVSTPSDTEERDA